MKKFKSLFILLAGFLFLVACGKKPEIKIEVDSTLTLQVDQEVKLTINHVAKDLTFEGTADIVEIRTSGDDVFVKGLKAGETDVTVTYKPNVKVSATIKVKVVPKPVSKGYEINFSVTAPEGFTGDVYVTGDFDGWSIENAVKLTLADGKYTGKVTFETELTEIEYKYFNHTEWSYGEGNESGGHTGNRKVTLEAVTNVEDIILSWESVYVPGEETEYTLTFNVTVPEGTEGKVFVVGEFTNWLNEGHTALELTKNADGTYSGSVKYTTDKAEINYKYLNAKDLASIGWDFEDTQEGNRKLNLETPTATDTVEAWKGGGYKAGAVEKDYTLNFKVTVPFALPEGYKVWVVGFDGWDAENALELTADALVYSVTTTLKTDKTVIDYMVVTGETFSFDHKPLKADGSEYGFGDNITHTLIEGVNEIAYQVHAWKDLSETPAEPQDYELTFNVTAPADTEGKVYLVGDFTGWLNEGHTAIELVKQEDGTYKATFTYETAASKVEYKYVNAKDLESLNYDFEDTYVGNRKLNLETPTATDTVEAWKGGGYKAGAVEVEYTLNFSFTIDTYLPEGYKVFLIGDFNAWKTEEAVELTGVEKVYNHSTTYTTSKTTIDYMLIVGEAFNWDYKVLKADGSEYGQENIVHTLTEGVNQITHEVVGFAGITEPVEPEMVDVVIRLTSVPETTDEHPIKLIGSMTGWNAEDAKLFVKNGDVYELTLNIDKNVENEFKIYLDKNQENWSDHQASPDGVADSENYVINAEEYEALLVEMAVAHWKGLTAPVEPVEHTLTFTVSVPEGTEGEVFVVGDFGNWLEENNEPLLLTKNEEGKYVGTVKYTTSALEVEYKYVNAKDLESISYDFEEIHEGNRSLDLEDPNAVETVEGWKDGGYKEPLPEVDYTLNFEVTIPYVLPEGYRVVVMGEFNGWDEEAPLVLEADATKLVYSGTKAYSTSKDELQYMVVVLADETFSWDHKALKDDLSEYGEENMVHELVEGVNDIKVTILAWKDLTEPVEPDIKSFTVKLGEIPASTGDYPIKLIGTMIDWENGTPLEFTKVDGVLQVTFDIDYNKAHAFKVYLDKGQANWADHEAASDINTPWDNYELKVDYLAENTEVELNIPFWLGLENPEPEVDYTLNFEVTIPYVLPEGYRVVVMGEFNGWDQEAPLVLEADATKLVYSGTKAYSTSKDELQYMVVALAGETFSWDHKALKDDLSEYGEENMVHELVEGVNNIEITIPGWKGLTAPVEEDIKPFTVKLAGLPRSTGEYPIRLIGTMTNNWSSEDALTFEKVGDVLQVTFNIDYNQAHAFKVYLDKGQANWSEHEAATDINTGWTDNYQLTVEYLAENEEVTLEDIAYWKGIENPQPISEVYNLAKEADVLVEVVVTGVNGVHLYVEDNTGAIYVYSPNDHTAVVGDKVLVNGKKDIYSGLHQIKTASVVVLSSNNELPQPTVKDNVAGFVDTQQSQRFSISGLTVKSKNGQNLTVTDGTNDIVVRSASSSGAIFDHLQTPLIGQTVNIVAMHLGWFVPSAQFAIIDVDQLVFLPASDELKVDNDILAIDLPATIIEAMTLDLIAEGPNGSSITWVSSHPDIISAAGVVTIPTEDTMVTLTATLTLNDVTKTKAVEINVMAEIPGTLMIYEVYGGGGNSGATYKNDYIVLYNGTSEGIDLTGYSIQYASAKGTTWQQTNLVGSIAAGGYYLIQQAAGTGGTTDLPTPDVVGDIAMAGSNGKVALVNSTTALTGSNPTEDPAVVDFVGYGTADAYEGSAATPAASNTKSVQRIALVDTNDNATDFQAVPTDLSYLITP